MKSRLTVNAINFCPFTRNCLESNFRKEKYIKSPRLLPDGVGTVVKIVFIPLTFRLFQVVIWTVFFYRWKNKKHIEINREKGSSVRLIKVRVQNDLFQTIPVWISLYVVSCLSYIFTTTLKMGKFQYIHSPMSDGSGNSLLNCRWNVKHTHIKCKV